jgi:hypothetical protein
MATYYVISTGSSTSPYDTLAKGSATIQGVFDNIDLAGGDIVEICADTVGGSKTFTENVIYGSNDGGVSGNPVIIRGRTGDSITVTSSSGNYTWTHTFGVNYVRYQNLTITSGVVAAFRLRQATGPEFIDCTFTDTNEAGAGLYIDAAVTGLVATRIHCEGSAGKGMFINAATTGTITDSTFNLNGNYGAEGYLGGITWTNNEFAYNKSHGFCSDLASSGVIIVGGSSHDNCSDYPTCSAGSYRHGYAFVDGQTNFSITRTHAYNVDMALDIQASLASNSTGTVAYNLFVGKEAGDTEDGTGIFLGAANASYSNSAINIYNNVIISEDVDGDSVYVGLYNASDVVLKNNILYNSASGNVYGSYADLTTDYNLWYSAKASPFNDKGTARTFAEWKTASSQDANSKSADPLFRSATDFRLKAGSPAINTGVAIDGLTTDILGKPIRGLPDIGCYEFQPMSGNFAFTFGIGF